MNEITPAESIQWQNTIQEKGYSKTYERMIQNQLNALFNHAQKIYNLKENPCKNCLLYTSDAVLDWMQDRGAACDYKS